MLLKILRSPNIASREHVYRYYDTEVMGNAVIRPGEADAGLIAPVRGEKFGLALAVDSNPFYGRISPYWGGATAVAEAMRNVACDRRDSIHAHRLPELRQPGEARGLLGVPGGRLRAWPNPARRSI